MQYTGNSIKSLTYTAIHEAFCKDELAGLVSLYKRSYKRLERALGSENGPLVRKLTSDLEAIERAIAGMELLAGAYYDKLTYLEAQVNYLSEELKECERERALTLNAMDSLASAYLSKLDS